MKKYSVSIPWHASVFVKVEANSEEEAKEKAFEQATASVCCHCSSRVQMDEMNDSVEPDVVEVEE